MNIRSDANALLVVIQIALESGEWTGDQEPARNAAARLERDLGNCSPAHVVEKTCYDLAEVTSKALATGQWRPGDWASEWQNSYVGEIVSLSFGAERTAHGERLAA